MKREPPRILNVWMWAYEPRNVDSQRGGLKKCLGWMDGYERLAELALCLPAKRLVYVADRKAGMLPLMVPAQQLDCPVDWLVRAAHNCGLPSRDKLQQHVTEGAPLGEIEFVPAARPGSKARLVRQ